jgi:hypothetical protein
MPRDTPLYFCPFSGRPPSDIWDFDVKEITEKLGLSVTQSELLKFMLRDIEVEIAFEHAPNKAPTMVMMCFWSGESTDGGCTVNQIDFVEFMREALEFEEIGSDESDKAIEIDALEKLKAVIDGAISYRRNWREPSL